MKKTIDALINSLLYALYMFLSCLVVMFAEILAVKIANLFVVTGYYELCILRAVIYTLGVNGILGIIAFREGFKNAKATPVATAISGVLATFLYGIFCLLFSFEAFCAGGVKSIAVLAKFGESINSSAFKGTLDRFDIIPYFFMNAAIYIVVMIALNAVGAHRRRLDRIEMNVVTQEEQTQTEGNQE
jgi:hypothetical protein